MDEVSYGERQKYINPKRERGQWANHFVEHVSLWLGRFSCGKAISSARLTRRRMTSPGATASTDAMVTPPFRLPFISQWSLIEMPSLAYPQ